MATCRDQIEKGHFLWKWKRSKNNDKPWQEDGKSSKWLKRQMNKFIRKKNKYIEEDEQGYKTKRKPTRGWEY